MNIKLTMVVIYSVTATLFCASNVSAEPPNNRVKSLKAAVIALQAENAAKQA